MHKIVNEDGVLWDVEKEFISGIWHTHKKFLGMAEKEEKKKNKKGEEN